VLEIFYILRMGETAAGKKTRPGRNGTSTITLPRGGAGPWGKEKSTTTRGSGEGKRTGRTWARGVGEIVAGSLLFVECVVGKLISG